VLSDQIDYELAFCAQTMRNFTTIVLLALLFVLTGVVESSRSIFSLGKKDKRPLTKDMKLDLEEARTFLKNNDPNIVSLGDILGIDQVRIYQYAKYTALVRTYILFNKTRRDTNGHLLIRLILNQRRSTPVILKRRRRSKELLKRR
jgi:hypothetical protein